jgi:AcrR family transcriptional regulator
VPNDEVFALTSADPLAGGQRAPRMSPEDRREMLIAATLPLVARQGLKVTTRQIAEAAGVAEGTIFRVFPDKDALVQAAVTKALDTAPILAELDAVDITLPLRERLAAVTGILQRRFVMVFNLMIAAGMHGPPPDIEDHRAQLRPRHAAILSEIGRILEPDHEKLRCPIPEVVRILRLLTFSGSHPLIADGRMLTPDEITDVLLHGTMRHHDTDSTNTDSTNTDSTNTDEREEHRC